MSYSADLYLHDSDRAAFKALKAIPGFHQFVKAFMRIWSERQFRIINMSSRVKMNEGQLAKYYNMLPPICEKLGIDVPELYLQLDVNPNSYTSGDTNPFIVVTSGLFETLPEELIPTVLAHECGHIACHHVLYRTMGNMILNGANSALKNYAFGGLAMLPLMVAFYYWMRCSELSADRAAVLVDGESSKMTEVCVRLAGFDKDIEDIASKEQFLMQARDYREMVNSSAWDKTLEFFALSEMTHPLMTVRALECEEWGSSDQYKGILNGTYKNESVETIDSMTSIAAIMEDTIEKKPKVKIDVPKFMRKSKAEQNPEEESNISVPDEIRQYKALYDEGILTEEEFNAKKKQLLGL